MRGKPGRGFTLVECAFAGAAVLVAFALLGLMAGRTRKMGQLGESMANLRRIGELTGSYGADYQERFWTFTWSAYEVRSDLEPDLRERLALARDKFEAAAVQAVNIIRRRSDETAVTLPPIGDWAPHGFYSHLVLADYAGTTMPSSFFISPGDGNRQHWSNDRAAFRRGEIPNQPTAIASNYRYMYSSSYFVSPYIWQQDRHPGFAFLGSGESMYLQAVYVAPDVNAFDAAVQTRRTDELRFPSQKALSWEGYSRFFGPREAYFQFPEARLPILFGDGTVGVRQTQLANRGWNPRLPSGFSFQTVYRPEVWEPSAPGRNRTDAVSVSGFFRYTRQGLQGRDFDGPEVAQP